MKLVFLMCVILSDTASRHNELQTMAKEDLCDRELINHSQHVCVAVCDNIHMCENLFQGL